MQYVLLGIFFFVLGDAIGIDGIVNIGHKIVGLF